MYGKDHRDLEVVSGLSTRYAIHHESFGTFKVSTTAKCDFCGVSIGPGNTAYFKWHVIKKLYRFKIVEMYVLKIYCSMKCYVLGEL